MCNPMVLHNESTSKTTQSRKWLITINNPIEKDWTHDNLKNALQKMNLVYWCMSDEKGETFHTHIYLVSKSPIRRVTLDNLFTGGHFDKCKGSSAENRDYVFKIGKWLGSDKEDTNFPESHEEYGELPTDRPGARTDITELYELIKEGCSNYEIMENNPKYMLHMDKVERARQSIREEEFKDKWRSLEVTYIFGKTGAGKTRGVMEQYGYSNVYRVTDYEHPFDSYKGQEVIIFEEFRSSLRIDDMLKYLDGYPVELPARYMNRVACFSKVYIISNIDIRDQFPNVQREQPETWSAFLRRIHSVKIYNGVTTGEMPLQIYLDIENPFILTTPFDDEGGE